ncbi:MAG: ACP S-malonyltransferase [Chloroflexota bacterium]|nr:ACP S-malonyltransferase [Chloroflexota bacterium]
MLSEPGGGVAYLFPGQGSQLVGMGRALYEADESARRLWVEADTTLGLDLSRLAFEGPEAELQRTEHAQPALLVASLAALGVLRRLDPERSPDFLAGHSLGEYTALVAAGSLAYLDALRLVRRRGELMARAGERTGGAMAAVIGLDPEELAEICVREGVDVANYNSPEQTVISGEPEGVARACEAARAAGARRVIPLAVSGAFHSRLMRSAAEELAGVIERTPIVEPQVPVVGNVHASPLQSADEIRLELREQLYSPVRWTQSLQYLASRGVTRYVEVGPGKVLAGLVRKTLAGASVESADSLLVAVGG